MPSDVLNYTQISSRYTQMLKTALRYVQITSSYLALQETINSEYWGPYALMGAVGSTCIGGLGLLLSLTFSMQVSRGHKNGGDVGVT
jgi:hypothetical protein